MHIDPSSSPAIPPAGNDGRYWFQTLTRYHWFVLFVAALGWLFDCLDQQLFILARPGAMETLVAKHDDPLATATAQRRAGDVVTSIFIVGWACGGLFFGVLGDRIGRAKTMLITILLYSAFTGLSALSVGVWDFALYRFLTGLGVGGEFAVGVALVAEVMPGRARPYALSLLQALSAIGNISAALIFLYLGTVQENSDLLDHWWRENIWRIMFVVGALPAFVALLVRFGLKEPEQWQKASRENVVTQKLGSYRDLFRDPVWRRHAILGLILGCSGIIGLWSIGFYSPDLIRYVQRKGVSARVYNEKIEEAERSGAVTEAAQWREIRDLEQQGTKVPEHLRATQAPAENAIRGQLTRWSSYTSLMLNVGAAFGMFGFGALAQRIGRKPTFTIALLAACVSTMAVFWFLTELWQIFVMVPVMGFCQLSLFAGYALYFPELFPTRLRSTGTSFCYNVGRFIAAGGPLVKTALEGAFQSDASQDPTLPIRYAGVAMCAVFLVGLFVLPFLPETLGKPLPE